MSFPTTRMRRLRRNKKIRDMVAETMLSINNLLYPMFIIEGKGIIEPISSMPGINRFSIDKLVEECKKIMTLGIPAVMFFGIPDQKDTVGTIAYAENGIIPRAIYAVKKAVPELLLVPDVCLCEYTNHGHCGIIKQNEVDNDSSVELLAKAALAYAKAGADMVAPSDMMDGRILKIRKVLNQAGFEYMPIISYSAKYASVFYSPFRDAADNTPQFGDRRTYQMDPRNSSEALCEILLDIEEGADIVMIKPALSYLDIISRIRKIVNIPIAAYNVSGEYAMLKATAERGWINYEYAVMEILTSIKRAGADIILTYHAKDVANFLGNK